MRARRLAVGGAAVVAAWIGALIALGAALEGGVRQRVADRIGESLGAAASIADGDLALVRGHYDFTGLAVRRDDLVGHLAIDVAAVECTLAPLGGALVDRDCGTLAVRGTRVEVSTAALFKLVRPKRAPIHADRVVIDDAAFVFAPSAFLPDLGKIEIRIAHAESGPTTFKTPLSWLFALRELDASIALPAGIALRLAYRGGVLSAAGSVFGSTPVELPVDLPVQQLGEDAAAELGRLVAGGTDLAERLVAKKAEDWLKSKLR